MAMVIDLAGFLNQDITANSGINYLVLNGGLQKIINIDGIRFYPVVQQYIIEANLCFSNDTIDNFQIEFGIEENLSVSNRIVLFKGTVKATSNQTFEIKKHVFLRSLNYNSQYNYKFYIQIESAVNYTINIRGYITLLRINKFINNVPY